jgi:hypothetical protein
MPKLKIGDMTLATIRSWELKKTTTGSKYVKIIFSNRISKTLWATEGVFKSPKAAQIFWDTLATMGFKGSLLSMLANDGALDTETQFEVSIEDTRDYQGKTYYEAGWINAPFKAGFKDSGMTDDELSEFDIDASMHIEGTVDLNKPAVAEDFAQQPEYKAEADANFAASDIPF